ncbi:hypothetical protein [Pseudacidovorax sp. NFM-22]|uniref:hypothetical protein n=1 Tax=Pseudacidovorax sp. NFM-22 TaxID=2744469 RepID=UPI001F210DC3|nr:hypothetical protein [Pseudacidovorax sp. NFM-22]
MTTWFHFAATRLGAGSIIEPGNYGRLLRCYQHSNDPQGWKVATELLFEAERQRFNQALPSRLNACFAFPTKEAANAGRAGLGGAMVLLHEVEPVDADALSHVGDFNLLTICYSPQAGSFWQRVEGAAKSYWARSGPVLIPEVVTGSALRVIRRFE